MQPGEEFRNRAGSRKEVGETKRKVLGRKKSPEFYPGFSFLSRPCWFEFGFGVFGLFGVGLFCCVFGVFFGVLGGLFFFVPCNLDIMMQAVIFVTTGQGKHQSQLHQILLD